MLFCKIWGDQVTTNSHIRKTVRCNWIMAVITLCGLSPRMQFVHSKEKFSKKWSTFQLNNRFTMKLCNLNFSDRSQPLPISVVAAASAQKMDGSDYLSQLLWHFRDTFSLPFSLFLALFPRDWIVALSIFNLQWTRWKMQFVNIPFCSELLMSLGWHGMVSKKIWSQSKCIANCDYKLRYAC